MLNRERLHAPAFNPGQVIDLTYSTGDSLPNRIHINAVFSREQDNQWIYRVLLESTGAGSDMTESFICERKSKKTAHVYNNPDVIDRYAKGWRFCGNRQRKTKAIADAEHLKMSVNIQDIMIWPALDAEGRLVRDEWGVWIRYLNIINDDGILRDDSNCGIKIK